MDLYVREATGDYRVARPREVLDSARDCVGQVFGKGRHIEKPAVAAGLFAGKLAGLESERFAVLFLNQQHHVLAYEELGQVLLLLEKWRRDAVGDAGMVRCRNSACSSMFSSSICLSSNSLMTNRRQV